MPFVRIGYLEGQYHRNDLPSISRSIHDALIECFNVPEDDYFHVFHAHTDGEFFYNKHYLNVSRTDKLLFIQVTCGAGRSAHQKRDLYKMMAELLSARCNIGKEDVFVILNETELEDWSFGNGIAQMIVGREEYS